MYYLTIHRHSYISDPLSDRREGGPEEDGCHKLEDTCAQKR